MFRTWRRSNSSCPQTELDTPGPLILHQEEESAPALVQASVQEPAQGLVLESGLVLELVLESVLESARVLTQQKLGRQNYLSVCPQRRPE